MNTESRVDIYAKAYYTVLVVKNSVLFSTERICVIVSTINITEDTPVSIILTIKQARQIFDALTWNTVLMEKEAEANSHVDDMFYSSEREHAYVSHLEDANEAYENFRESYHDATYPLLGKFADPFKALEAISLSGYRSTEY